MKPLIFSPSPHIRSSRTTRGAMTHVIIALLPAVFCALWYFGLPALTVLFVSVASCMAVEWLITRFMLHRPSTLGDGTAMLTGILLALNLPSSLPWWMVAAGAVMAIGIAKMAFGGLGCNIFNPALVGRVFLLISFPVAMTTWPLPQEAFPLTDAFSGASTLTDGTSGATVLATFKQGYVDFAGINYRSMLLGDMKGSMGEVSALALLLGFVYLLVVRVIKPHIPLSIIAGLCIIDFIADFPVLPDIFAGGLLLGAIFMATDYVTSPMTGKGMVVYGLLIGVITASIRRWGAYPEGMSFAILMMNGAVPLIDRYIKPRRYSPRNARKATL